jgi:hypothetical protein
MNLVRDVANELLGMFAGVLVLSGAILLVVAGSALLIKTETVTTQWGVAYFLRAASPHSSAASSGAPGSNR